MNLISEFFKKFQQFERDSEETKDKIIQTIKSLSGTNLEKEKISLKEGVISIKCSPLERTQIYMSKGRIIELLNSTGLQVRDIK